MSDPLGTETLFEMASETPTLADRFGVPPFTVLDTRQGVWQERKRRWLALGIRSELGREGVTIGQTSETSGLAAAYAAQRRGPVPLMRDAYASSNLTGAQPLPDWANNGTAQMAPGTSIFDPVLCELVYRWFAPPDALILDPFAGGSVRGIVASHLGHQYVGVDLSAKQIAANNTNLTEVGEGAHTPIWICGDSRDISTLADMGSGYDLIFTCPPYADLERYSDDPADISTLAYPDFRDAYANILTQSVALLRNHRYAVLVVGEVRGADGACYGLVPDTITIMRDAGLQLYNDAILINMVGTLALRVSRNFVPGRKLGRSHQYVLTFVRGDGRAAADACGPLEIDE